MKRIFVVLALMALALQPAFGKERWIEGPSGFAPVLWEDVAAVFVDDANTASPSARVHVLKSGSGPATVVKVPAGSRSIAQLRALVLAEPNRWIPAWPQAVAGGAYVSPPRGEGWVDVEKIRTAARNSGINFGGKTVWVVSFADFSGVAAVVDDTAIKLISDRIDQSMIP